MGTNVTPAPDAHVWAAIAATAHHAIAHRLPQPLNMTPEPDHVWVHVQGDHEPDWFATLTDPVGNYDDEHTTPNGTTYLRAVTWGTLPDTGVRVRVTANIVRPRTGLQVVGS